MLLHLLFCLVSLGATAILYGSCQSLSAWWLALCLPGFYAAGAVVYILVLMILSIFLPKTEDQQDKPLCRWILLRTANWVLPFCRTRSTVRGLEKLPADKPFLLVCNHVSNLDPIVTLVLLRRWPLAFVSKPENFKIPIVGTFIRCCSFLSIDRENPRNAVTTIHRASDRITEKNLCMGIYPEGTRSKGGQLLPFHPGSFKIAKMAKCPIAVLSIRYHPRRWFLGMQHAELEVLEMLDADFVEENRTNALAERARAAIEDNLQSRR